MDRSDNEYWRGLRVSNRTNRILCLSLMTLMLTVGLLPFVPTVSATNDPVNQAGITDVLSPKDWTVTDVRTYDHAGATIIMDGGNVIVANGGTLTLDHVALLFTVASDGAHGIVVQAGGTLIMKNGAVISSNSFPKTIFCGFLAGSTVSISLGGIGSVAGKVLGSPYTSVTGIYIGTKNITLNQLVAINNWDSGNANQLVPLVYVDADGVTFKNSTLQNLKGSAIYANRTTTVIDTNIKFTGPPTNTGTGIYAPDWCGGLTLLNVGISLESYGVYSSTDVTIDNSKINNNTNDGVYVDTMSSLTLKNTEVANNDNGVSLWDASQGTISKNDRIFYNFNYGLELENLAYADVTNSRISFNQESNIYSLDSTLDMTNGLVEDSGSGGASVDLETNSQGMIKDSNLLTSGTGTFVNVAVVGNSYLNITGTKIDGTMDAFGLYLDYGSSADVEKNTFPGHWGGIMAETGSMVNSKNNVFTDYAIFALDSYLESYITSFKDTGSSTGNVYVAVASEQATIDMRNGDFTQPSVQNIVASTGTGSTIYLTDSKFTTASTTPTLGANSDSYIRVISCSGLDPLLTKSMNNGIIEFGWHVAVQTQWQNHVAAPEALVEFNDRFNVTTTDLVTGADGTAKTDVIALTVLEGGQLKHNKYNVNASLDGMTGSTIADIIKDRIGPGTIVVNLTDDSAPSIDVVFPTDNWVTNETQFTMNGTADDVGSMLEGVYVQLDSAMGWTAASGLNDWTYDLDLTEGTHVIKVEARDMAGLVADRTVNVVVDLTAPTITIDQPTGLYVTSSTFYLNGTTEANTTVTVNGTGVLSPASKFSQQFTLPDGTYDILVTAQDLAGNTGSKHVAVIVDTVPPTLTSDAADKTWLNTKSFTLTGKSDGNQVMVNGVNATLDKTNKTWKIQLTLVEGANSLALKALDLAGNKKEMALTLNVDTTPPVLVITSPTGTGTYYTNNATLKVTGKVTDTNTVTLNGGAITIGTDGNFTQTVTLVNGNNAITIVAKDIAGNEASWTRNFVLDTVAPKITITSPKNGLVTNQAGQTIVGTVDDVAATIKQGTTNVTNTNGSFSTAYTLVAGANTITVTATDLAGNVGTATITVTLDTTSLLTITTPKKLKVTSTSETVKIEGTAEKGAVVTINDMAIPVDANGAFSIKYTLKEGKNTLNVKSVDPAGNPATQTLTVTYNDEKQYSMMMLLGLGILLMIIGLVLGLVVGRAMAKPKAPPPEQMETEAAPEKAFTPEEEVPEEKPAPKVEPEPKPAPKAEPKPEPKVEPKPAPKEQPKPAANPDGSLEDLLKGLDKK